MAVSEPGTVAPTANPYVDAIMGDDKWGQSITPISYGFTRVEGASNAWTADDMIPVFAAINAFSDVAKLQFEYSLDGPTADIEFYLVNSLPAAGALGASNGPEGRIVNGQSADGNTFFNQPGHADWLGNSSVGGASYYTIIHEIGHALGLEHPHDRKDNSGLFPGVDDQRDTGEFGLNISLNTIMSYNYIGSGAWSPSAEQNFGFMTGPMAFDIAALQHMYGKNMSTGAGKNAYALPGVNDVGTAYTCIWDAGGKDEIIYRGLLDCTIDLREAPLTGKDAGGYLSRVDGIFGGFTIAKGAVIENAGGGSGNDTVTGNNSANIIQGFAGDDKLKGLGGNDRLDGGFGFDLIDGGSGVDQVTYAFLPASTGMVVDLAAGKTTFVNETRFDKLVSIEDVVGGGGADRIIGNTSANTLDGALGNDLIEGGSGRDTLIGNMGADILTGGADGDKFTYTKLFHSSGGFVDKITDFQAGVDDFDVQALNIAAGLGSRSFSSTFSDEIFTDIGTANANQMLLLTVTGAKAGTYLFINDGIAKADWTKDALIDITGLTGTLSINDFI